jgi:beta-barrel assembly-enhancing protease
MRSTSAPSDGLDDLAGSTPASWYDGVTALRHDGQASWDASGTLVLDKPGAAAVAIPLADLRFQDAGGNRRIYTRAGSPDFRLHLPRDLPPALARRLPAPVTYGRWIDRLGLGPATVALGIASAAAVALFLTAPQWLGPMVPPAWERRIGDAMVGDLGNRLCVTPASEAALAKLASAIEPGGSDVRLGIANVDMVNAVALPGSRVLLFDGLVQQAGTPEEVAGVLAHEVGHVRARHVMSAMLRQFGLTILLAGANSGTIGSLFGIATLTYSRAAEQEADAMGRQMLARADISPLGAADFFRRMSGEQDELEDEANWFASHPAPRERAAAYRAAALPGHAYQPPLTAAEFAALKRACRDDRDVEGFDLF